MGPRHALVIASRCHQLPLPGLDEAAEALHRQLLDEACGACLPALPDGRSLLTGFLGRNDVTGAVHEAARRAAEAEATLVLAILGHAFIPRTEATLYYMTADSQESDRGSAVNVNELLVEAVDRNGIRGLVGVIDTCHAAAALSRTALQGNRAGQYPMSLLLAAGTDQQAFDLDVSRDLTALLDAGLPGAGAHIDVRTVAAEIGRRRLGRQSVTSNEYNGDWGAAAPMWLGINRRYQPPVGLLGAQGREALREAIASVGEPDLDRFASPRIPDDLWSFIAHLAGLHPGSTGGLAGRKRAMTVANDLAVAMRTIRFIREHLSSGLTRSRLCSALRFALPLRSPVDLINEVDFVECVALEYPAPDEDCRATMDRFILALADSADVDLAQLRAEGKFEALGPHVLANRAQAQLLARRRERKLHLIVRLHGTNADAWPDDLEAWLADSDGSSTHHVFQCGEPSDAPDPTSAEARRKARAEATLSQVVTWANELVEDMRAEGAEVDLRRIDVAVPAGLLVRWRPEEVIHGVRLLVHYDVVCHWSRRFDPPFPWMHELAIKRVAEMEQSAAAMLTWLDELDMVDMAALQHRLINGGDCGPGLGLAQRPPADLRLVELVLAHAPVVVLPEGARVTERQRQAIESTWDTLPEAILDAYRARRGDSDGDGLAGLRFVWDDKRWLSFCRRIYRHRSSPRSAT